MTKTRSTAVIIASLTAVLGVSSLQANEVNTAAEESPETPLELRRIMRDMGDEMKVITGAISHEDWALVAKTAPKIADHPQPPFSEKIRILAFAGTDISQFKDLDGKTHAAAKVLGEVAVREDGHAVIDSFSALQQTCLACHQRFRTAFQEHFYGED